MRKSNRTEIKTRDSHFGESIWFYAREVNHEGNIPYARGDGKVPKETKRPPYGVY